MQFWPSSRDLDIGQLKHFLTAQAISCEVDNKQAELVFKHSVTLLPPL